MNSTSSNFSQDDSPMQDDELMTNLRKRIEEQELKEQDEAPLEYSVDASVARTIQIDADSEDNVWLIKGTWEDPDEFFTMDAGDAAYVIVLNSEEDAQLLLRVLSFQDQIPPTSAVERLTWRSVLAYTNDIGLEFGFIETGQLVSSLSKEDLDRIRARGDLNDKNLVERLKNVFEREMFDSSAPASDIPAWEQIDGEQGEDKDDKDVDER